MKHLPLESYQGSLSSQVSLIVIKGALFAFITNRARIILGIFTTIAVVVFGIKGDDRDWMPDPEHNFLSWSFGLAVVGAFFNWMASILFLVESRMIERKEEKREREQHYGMHTNVKA